MKLQQSASQVESALSKKPRGKGLKGLCSDLKAQHLGSICNALEGLKEAIRSTTTYTVAARVSLSNRLNSSYGMFSHPKNGMNEYKASGVYNRLESGIWLLKSWRNETESPHHFLECKDTLRLSTPG